MEFPIGKFTVCHVLKLNFKPKSMPSSYKSFSLSKKSYIFMQMTLAIIILCILLPLSAGGYSFNLHASFVIYICHSNYYAFTQLSAVFWLIRLTVCHLTASERAEKKFNSMTWNAYRLRTVNAWCDINLRTFLENEISHFFCYNFMPHLHTEPTRKSFIFDTF